MLRFFFVKFYSFLLGFLYFFYLKVYINISMKTEHLVQAFKFLEVLYEFFMLVSSIFILTLFNLYLED